MSGEGAPVSAPTISAAAAESEEDDETWRPRRRRRRRGRGRGRWGGGFMADVRCGTLGRAIEAKRRLNGW